MQFSITGSLETIMFELGGLTDIGLDKSTLRAYASCEAHPIKSASNAAQMHNATSSRKIDDNQVSNRLNLPEV